METAEAQRNSMAAGQTQKKTQVARTIKTARNAVNVSRDLLRALRVFEASLDFDYFGRVVWEPDETAEQITREVRDLLCLARDDYPDQEIAIDVTVKVPPAGDPRRQG